jgi:hypothetical protein
MPDLAFGIQTSLPVGWGANRGELGDTQRPIEKVNRPQESKGSNDKTEAKTGVLRAA